MFKKIVNVCYTYLTKTSIEHLKLDVTLLHCKIISKLNTQIKLQPDHFNEFFSNLVPTEMDLLSFTQYFTTHESFWSAVKFVTVTPSTTYCNDMIDCMSNTLYAFLFNTETQLVMTQMKRPIIKLLDALHKMFSSYVDFD